jgi:TatD DNase family protein
MEALPPFPTLDAHAHLKNTRSAGELAACGAVLAMTLSLEEASQTLGRADQMILWGVGCHPGEVRAQQDFDAHAFQELIRRTPVVGEVGLDRRSQVPFEIQLKTLRNILSIVADNPRIVSIHSNHATAEVLEELNRQRISIAVLHWWSASNSRTKTAVDLGCYFSINPAIADHSRFSKNVPLERILLETDHGYDDMPQAIPGRIEATEHIVAQKYLVDALSLRRKVWRNFKEIIHGIGFERHLADGFEHLDLC